jgi:hypothetical protein
VDAVRRSYQWLAIGNLLVVGLALLAAFWGLLGPFGAFCGLAAVWLLPAFLAVAAVFAWQERTTETE